MPLPGPGPQNSLPVPQRDPSHHLDIDRHQIVMGRLNIPASPILGQELTNSHCQGTRLRTDWFAANGARYPAISPNVCGLPVPNPSYEAALQSLVTCQDCSPSVRGIHLVFCSHKFFVREIFPFQNSGTQRVWGGHEAPSLFPQHRYVEMFNISEPHATTTLW